MKFIEVTTTKPDEPMFINIEHITWIRPLREEERKVYHNNPKDEVSQSIIEIDGYTLRVKDTMKEIEARIRSLDFLGK